MLFYPFVPERGFDRGKGGAKQPHTSPPTSSLSMCGGFTGKTIKDTLDVTKTALGLVVIFIKGK